MCLAMQLPLWPNGTSANKDDGYALHKPLQQPSNQVRLHQQKPATQHQQCPTQAGKRKVSPSTLILMCMPPLSSNSMQAACYKAHTRSEKTSTNKVREYKILKKRESERRHNPPQTHHDKATETPRNQMHTLNRDKNLSSLIQIQEIAKEAKYTSKMQRRPKNRPLQDPVVQHKGQTEIRIS